MDNSNDKEVKVLLQEISNRWKFIGQNQIPKRDLELELRVYRKMIEVLQVGRSYFFIFIPPTNRIEFVSDSMENILGYSKEEFDTEFFVSQIHPEDFPTFVKFEKMVVDFKVNLAPDKILKYKSRYNYRIRKSDGEYLPILQQSITIQSNENGAVIRNLVVHTDISEYKTDSIMKLSFIGLEGSPSFIGVGRSHEAKLLNPNLSKREVEILSLLGQNKSSKEIAEQLFISIETVRTHRKNLLRKTNSNTTLQMILKEWIKNG